MSIESARGTRATAESAASRKPTRLRKRACCVSSLLLPLHCLCHALSRLHPDSVLVARLRLDPARPSRTPSSAQHSLTMPPCRRIARPLAAESSCRIHSVPHTTSPLEPWPPHSKDHHSPTRIRETETPQHKRNQVPRTSRRRNFRLAQCLRRFQQGRDSRPLLNRVASILSRPSRHHRPERGSCMRTNIQPWPVHEHILRRFLSRDPLCALSRTLFLHCPPLARRLCYCKRDR